MLYLNLEISGTFPIFKPQYIAYFFVIATKSFARIFYTLFRKNSSLYAKKILRRQIWL